jgi:hypothetical protein
MPGMREIGENDSVCLFYRGHLVGIFTKFHNKLEPPKTIFLKAKASADSRSIWVADESKVLGKEEVVYVLR